LRTHRWNALGGWSTVFMGTTTYYVAKTFGVVKTTPLVTPITSQAGLRSLARNGIIIAGPALFGLWVGMRAFGDN